MKYFQQFDISDCGAACLAMIASHYGLRLSITEIRNIAGTDIVKGHVNCSKCLWIKGQILFD